MAIPLFPILMAVGGYAAGAAMNPVASTMNKLLNPILQPTVIDPQTATTAYWRGIVTREQWAKELLYSGYSDTRQQWLNEALKYTPSPTDVIRFGVREAFREDIVKEYGLDEDRPVMFKSYSELTAPEAAELPTEWREKGITYIDYLGMRSEDAKYYWRSHWELPPISACYEFLHRLNPEVLKILGKRYAEMGLDPAKLSYTQEDLNTLLRVHDIMPKWRDHLAAISYAPLTRVDLRRVYQLGLISDDEFVARNMELGYSKSDAELMLEWMKAEKEATVKERTKEERDLTKAEILRAYRLKQINEDEAKSSLTALGYDSHEISILMSLATAQEASEKREMNASMVLNLYRYGLIDIDETRTKLTQLEYDSEAADYMIALTDYKRQTDARPLPYTIIRGMFYAGLIDAEAYYNRLLGMGFLAEDARLLLEYDVLRAPKKRY